MNFIEGLPNLEGTDSILVVVNRFTKYANFVSLFHPVDAPKVARIFMDQMIQVTWNSPKHGFIQRQDLC